MPEPSPLVTFLFTDVEGSTRLWEATPERMGPALARHDALMREAIERHSGSVLRSALRSQVQCCQRRAR